MPDPRILVIAHAHEASGFARVVRGILGQIASRYDVHQLCLNSPPARDCVAWTRHYCREPRDPYGFDETLGLARELRPELVLIVQDLWIVPSYLEVLESLQPRCKTVAYCPLDGTLRRPGVVHPLHTLDALVTYLDWAKVQVQAAFSRLSRESGVRGPALHVVPHAIDVRHFSPVEALDGPEGRNRARLTARRRLFEDRRGFDDAFIVLNANQNQPRKRLDLTIEGFALFARGKPANVKLYLHTASGEPYPDLRAEAARCGIGDRVIFTAEAGRPPSVPDETLNLIYNACDVGLNTSMGEGWGLVSFEHAATGAAQIVPRHSACAELWQEAAVLVDASPVATLSRMPLRMSEVTAEGVAAALELLYEDRDLLARMGTAAQANAQSPGLSWESVGARWNQVLHEVLQ